jgi:hypothetical protein
MIKLCSRCNKTKHIDDFSNCTKNGVKKHTYCKECRNDQIKISRQKNPEKYRNIETLWRHNNPIKRLLICTRMSSRLKSLEHNIDESDLLLPEFCPLVGIKIDYSAGNGKTMEKPSVDRIDPNRGYVKGNVEVISSLANTMKSKATPEQLLFFAYEIIKRYKDEKINL